MVGSPAPARRPGVRLLVHPLLVWGQEDGLTQVAVRRQTPPIAHEMHVRQGHEGGQLLEEFEWREPTPWSPDRPRMGEGVQEIAVDIFLEALQRHRTAGGIADELCQLIP